MNYLLTILNTPVLDHDFIISFSRFMEPITETDGRYLQYQNGLLLYHFDTELELIDLRDHLVELEKSFGIHFILSEVNSTTTFCMWIEEVDGLLNLGPEIPTKYLPFVIEPQTDETENMFMMNKRDDDDNDIDDEVVQKLIQKYKLKDIEPTLDEILEKIYEKGTSSLSIQEQAVLNQFK